MPTYEYKCQNCQHQFEIEQSMSDVPLTECPECSGKIERVVTGGGGFLFKSSSHAHEHTPCCSRDEVCDNPKKCCEGCE
jgi:putative FmdB family regulatory protein